MKLLIDMDVIVYRSGYAAKNGDYLMNVEYADNILFSIFDRFGTDDCQGYLSGPTNFRYEVATMKPYKGNRDTSNRPKFYKEIREYMADHWGGVFVEGMEADDAMGLAQNDDTVICSIDKDLKIIPGRNYNFVTGDLTYITPEEGVYNFLRQMLIGDSADNIPGINKIGEVKSARLLQDKSPKEQLEVVIDLYKKQYGDKWESAFHEIATLLWIRQAGAITYKDNKLLYD